MADGAIRADRRRLVLGEALRLSGLGPIVGLAGAAAATRLVRSMLFEVEPLDPSALLGAALLLMVTSVFASLVPMRRAARLDPATVLRSE